MRMMRILIIEQQDFITQGAAKVALRQSQADSAKSAWLDAEGQYAVDKAAFDNDELTVASDLKKTLLLQDLVQNSQARLAKVKANNTEELSEIDEEEAIIRELLGYISDLTKSTVDVVNGGYI